MNIRAGICEDCGQYWTVTAGGLNDDGQCPECARRYPVKHVALDDHDDVERDLADDGAGLGV